MASIPSTLTPVTGMVKLKNIKILKVQSDIIAGKAFDLHVADPGSIPNVPDSPLSLPGVNLEHKARSNPRTLPCVPLKHKNDVIFLDER